MAKYSLELRKVCDLYTRTVVESWFKSYDISDYLTPLQIEVLEKNRVWSKDHLAKKIVDHYYMREIGFETPALFKHYAKITMQEIMEKYLLLIYSKFLEYDPLSNVDYDETYTREIEGEAQNTGSSNSNSNSNSNGMGVHSDTPQTNISKNDYLNGGYASSVDVSESDSNIQDETNTSSQGTSKTIEKYTHHMEGDNGVIVTNQYLVREFRELASNYDAEIIKELNTLFMGLY